MKKIDNSLNYYGAIIVSSDGGPILGNDGTWEVRTEASGEELRIVKEILKRNSLEIVREVEH